MAKKRILLLGASGLTGRHCLEQLLNDARVASVTTLVRRSLNIQQANYHELLFEQLDADAGDLFNVDAVICCLGTTLKTAGSKAAFYAVDFTLVHDMAKLTRQAGVETFTVISAVNANPRSMSFYARTKGELEKALKQLDFPHLILAQPSLLLGERQDKRFLEDVGQKLLKPTATLINKVSPNSTPITASNLAKALVNATLEPDQRKVAVLRYRELMQRT